MKIGIITIHKSPSYGACLQAFALWKFLSSKVSDCEIIDLLRPTHKEYVPSPHFDILRKSSLSLKARVIKTISFLIGRVYKTNKESVLVQRFNSFNAQIRYSRQFKGLDELYDNPPSYDLYITGSDQVWNPSQPYCMEPYFLTFVKNSGKKISYAASIGVEHLSSDEKEKYARWLDSYNAIGIREKSAQKLIASFSDKPTTVVLDPTFLLDESIWEKEAIQPTTDFPYTLLFSLSNSEAMINFAKRVARESKTSLLILAPNFNQKDNDSFIINNAGPREFLGYIKNADLVITDSFHGTVFSMIMKPKNFFTYVSTENKKGSRIFDLLDLFNLKEHLLTLNEGFLELNRRRIDYDKLNNRISEERSKSRDFLNNFVDE